MVGTRKDEILSLQRGMSNFWGVMDMLITFTRVVVLHVYTYTKVYKLYILNKCNLVYINYTLIKLFKQQLG